MPDDPDADLYGDLESAHPAEGEALLKAQLAEVSPPQLALGSGKPSLRSTFLTAAVQLSAKVEEQDQELLALRAQVASLQSEVSL